MAKDFLDSLNELFDSLYTGGRRAAGHDSGDPDLDTAWQDLDRFMGAGTPPRSGFSDLDRDFAEFDRRFASAGGKPASAADFGDLKAKARAKAEAAQREREQDEARLRGSGGAYRTNGGSQQHQQRPADDPLRAKALELVRDYHNLELKPGAGVDEVKAAYKRLLKQYHPDRFANDPAKQATTTQITAKLNQSYSRIMEHLGQK